MTHFALTNFEIYPQAKKISENLFSYSTQKMNLISPKFSQSPVSKSKQNSKNFNSKNSNSLNQTLEIIKTTPTFSNPNSKFLLKRSKTENYLPPRNLTASASAISSSQEFHFQPKRSRNHTISGSNSCSLKLKSQLHKSQENLNSSQQFFQQQQSQKFQNNSKSSLNFTQLSGDYSSNLTLNCRPDKRNPLIHSISNDILVEILENNFTSSRSSDFSSSHDSHFQNISIINKNSQNPIYIKFEIIDCRYPYEFEAGSIKFAKNVYNIEMLKQEYFSQIRLKDLKNYQKSRIETHKDIDLISQQDHNNNNLQNFRHILIFHCEHSIERAPAMIKNLRQLDRNLNEYPNLFYPEVYLLEGGFELFYGKFVDSAANFFVKGPIF